MGESSDSSNKAEQYAAEAEAYAAEHPETDVSGVPIAEVAAHIRGNTTFGATLVEAFEILDAPPAERRAFLEKEWAACCARTGINAPFPLPPLEPESAPTVPDNDARRVIRERLDQVRDLYEVSGLLRLPQLRK